MEVNEDFGGGFPHKVTVYVFSTRNLSEPLSDEETETLVLRTARFLSERFGGATALPGRGFYKAGDALVIEKITLVYASAVTLSIDDRKAVRDFVKDLKVEYGQEAVAVEIDGTLFFI